MTKASICVYCGSRPGLEPSYLHQAGQFGRRLAEQGWRLVYGAGDVGMMGEVARTARDNGADLFGVIPQHLLGVERERSGLARLVVTQTMHERKKVMFMNCDAAVVMPGGAGTLDEFFEVLTWRQLGLHHKPIVLIECRRLLGPAGADAGADGGAWVRRCRHAAQRPGGRGCRWRHRQPGPAFRTT